MARPRSERVRLVKQLLRERANRPTCRPGDPFLSARAVAARFNVSYQTAHRLLSELCDDGVLARRSASGTYIPGNSPVVRSAVLWFNPRAGRPDSFGATLMRELTRHFDAEGIEWSMRMPDPSRKIRATPDAGGAFPVVWEVSDVLRACLAARIPALLLNDRPQPGLQSMYLDSISIDDFFGGVCAAQLLRQRTGAKGGFAILGGPEHDSRSARRIDGFLSVVRAKVVHASGWYLEDGRAVADDVLSVCRSGMFCCNDRLAQAVLERCASLNTPPPAIVGFDNAPIARELGLTTIAIPWAELAGATARIVRARLRGNRNVASRLVIAPRPVIRWSDSAATRFVIRGFERIP